MVATMSAAKVAGVMAAGVALPVKGAATATVAAMAGPRVARKDARSPVTAINARHVPSGANAMGRANGVTPRRRPLPKAPHPKVRRP